jgi:hypothetical protein
MSDEMMKSIRSAMQDKETDELIQIWLVHDQTAWTDEAFEVVKELLIERLGKLPDQNMPMDGAENDLPEEENIGFQKTESVEDKLFGKIYTKINGDIQSEEFFTKRHNTLINIAAIANVLAYVILGITILAVIGDTFYFGNLCNADIYSCVNHNWVLALFGSSGQEVFHWFTQLFWTLGQGVIFSVILWGISQGLKMIVETDLNYREAAQEEKNDAR